MFVYANITAFASTPTTEYSACDPEKYKEALHKIKEGFYREHITFIAGLPTRRSGNFYHVIRDYLLKRKDNSFWYFLKLENLNIKITDLMQKLENTDTLEVIMEKSIYSSDVKFNLFTLHTHVTIKESPSSILKA